MAKTTDNTSPDDAEVKQRKRRSVMIALGLAAMAVMFFLITVLKLGGNIANRPL